MTVYELYRRKAEKALIDGYSQKTVIDELQREKATIQTRCMMKQAELAGDRNINKTREAARQARECIVAIDRLCKELEPKEINA